MARLKYISEVNYTKHTIKLIDIVEEAEWYSKDYNKIYWDIFYPDTYHNKCDTISFYAGAKDAKWIC